MAKAKVVKALKKNGVTITAWNGHPVYKWRVSFPDGANQSVKIRFSIEETDDFRTWIKRDGINEVTVPLEAGSKFYRFALEDE